MLTLGLGAAVVISSMSIAFGIGALVVAWFLSETFALQLAVLTGRLSRRDASWVRATMVTMMLVGIVVAATWLAVITIGPDVSTADRAQVPLPWPEALRRVGAIVIVTALTAGFIAPFVYTPLILIERGGTLGAAVVESAWLVRHGGLARHWVLALTAHVVPLLPAIVAAVVIARTFARSATPLGVLIALPLLPLSVPLGLGLVSSAYVAQREALHEPRWTRRESVPPRSLVAALTWVVVGPIVAVAFLLTAHRHPRTRAHGGADVQRPGVHAGGAVGLGCAGAGARTRHDHRDRDRPRRGRRSER